MKNGEIWLDDRGNPIQAHGGMITRFGGKWYWYGENKSAENIPGTTRVDVIGISCYTSRDLVNWHCEGNVLSADAKDPSAVLHPSRVVERPKVIYNEKTGRYIMWFHADAPDYTQAMAACAVSDSPSGSFRLVGSGQPNRLDCRDMTLFVDADQQAWLVHSGNWNKTLYFSRLTDDYLGFTGEYYAAFADQEREAPALFHDHGQYYCITSGCTGWQPNPALYGTSRHIACGWKLIDNPCRGMTAHKTFGGQSACVFEANHRFYLLLDHWKPTRLKESGYSILPIDVRDGCIAIRWHKEFNGVNETYDHESCSARL